MLWIWYSKHFSLSANAWIKSVTSQRLSLGFLPRRHFLHKIRRYKKHPEVQFLPDAHDFHAEDPEVWRSLDAGNVRDALLEVDKKYRVALELFYLNNLSYREIVDALGIPIGTVMSRLSRGKAQLRSILWRRHQGSQAEVLAR